MIPLLTGSDVYRHLPMPDAINAMRTAFRQISSGEAIIPLRSTIALPGQDAGALFMPGFLSGSGILGIKIVTLFKENPEKGLPLIHAMVVIMDGKTGAPRAVIDGESLTALRTGAASGLATDLLARKNAEVLTLFGAGVQGRTQLEAVAAVRDLKKAFIVDPDKIKTKEWIARTQPGYPFQILAGEPGASVREADIICTATTATEPVFRASDLRPGTHINAIGAYQPDRREIPPETVAAAFVVVDQRRACLAEAGDLVLAIREGYIREAHIAAELGEILTGLSPGRTADDQVTLFKSVGNSAQDLAAAERILQNMAV